MQVVLLTIVHCSLSVFFFLHSLSKTFHHKFMQRKHSVCSTQITHIQTHMHTKYYFCVNLLLYCVTNVNLKKISEEKNSAKHS